MHDSAKVYTPFVLLAYDFFVLWLSNTVAWRCPTATVLLPFFQKFAGTDVHLDIGVGTGYYPSHAVSTIAQTDTLCLVDLNPGTLCKAAERVRTAGYEGSMRILHHNIFRPLPHSLTGRFESISLFYLFHCLPGVFPEKAERVLAQVVPCLARGGTLYGATILGKDVRHNIFGHALMTTYNTQGIFCNWEDSEDGLRDALEGFFGDVDVRVVGVVATFVAKIPVRDGGCSQKLEM